MTTYTQVCRRGLELAMTRKSFGSVMSAQEGCSGGWTFETDEARPCPRCRHPLTVLSKVPR